MDTAVKEKQVMAQGSDALDRFDIVPTHLAVEAMRDNGYKNGAYALAELMDNAIQAEATVVELLCAEQDGIVEQRNRKRIYQIAVLDNGRGMDADTLRMALQFGNGTRLDSGKHTGIGRFGMGLPASSISQCRRVEVWSWQDGEENAVYSFLDIDKIKSEEISTVPTPVAKAIPTIWKKVGVGFGGSGTLVVWSGIDRCIWKTAETIIKNSEALIGRMYRKFLDAGKLRIRLAAFNTDTPASMSIDRDAMPNDPLYLMVTPTLPAPYDKEPMFEPWGDPYKHVIDFRGEKHTITVRFSLAKKEARANDNSGGAKHGTHAKNNVGVSIIRADRELELDQSMVISYDTRERWWGVEVDFPPSLDDLFGVTNNKQAARNFAEISKIDIETLLKDGTTIHQMKHEMEQDDDPRAPLIEVVNVIQSRIKSLRDLIKAQTAGTRSAQRYQNSSAEKTATARTKERQDKGFVGGSDKDESLPPEQRQQIIEDALKADGLPDAAAEDFAAKTVGDNLKYVFVDNEIETPAFFSVKPKGGTIIVTLNTNHPAYDNLVEVIEEGVDNVGAEELRSRLIKARDGIKLLLSAWARYEDELPDGQRKHAAQDMRTDWGRMARQFLDRSAE